MDLLGSIIPSLSAIGYTGDCLELEHLQYAVRVGACSWQYMELLNWIESQFICREADDKKTAKELIPLFKELRTSYLKLSNTGFACDPFEFRSKMLAYLVELLEKALGEGKGINVAGADYNQLKHDQKKAETISNKIFDSTVNGARRLGGGVGDTTICQSATEAVVAGTDERLIKLVIVSNRTPSGEIRRLDWQHLKYELQSHIAVLAEKEKQQLLPKSEKAHINFDNIIYNQMRTVHCDNMKSAQILRQVFDQLGFGQNYSLMTLDELRTEYIFTAWTWIGEYFDDSSIVLDLIALHNTICTDDWCVVKTMSTECIGQHYLLKLSRCALPLLRRNGGFLNFGANRIYLRLNKILRKDSDLSLIEMEPSNTTFE